MTATNIANPRTSIAASPTPISFSLGSHLARDASAISTLNVSSFETHRRALRPSRLTLTRWRRADVPFVKEPFTACFKAILRFDEASDDRLVVGKFGTSRSIIHRSRALEVSYSQITRG